MALGAFMSVREFDCRLCQERFTLFSGDVIVPDAHLCDGCLVELWPLEGAALKACIAERLAKWASQRGASSGSLDDLQALAESIRDYIVEVRDGWASAEAVIDDRNTWRSTWEPP